MYINKKVESQIKRIFANKNNANLKERHTERRAANLFLT